MKLQLLSIPLLVALLLSPLAAAAATGSIAFSSPATSFAPVGSTAYTITGTITPTPTLPDNVNIQVTEQGASGVFDATNVAVGTGGTFTYSTYAGGNSAWTTGTYVITATDSNGAAGTQTFHYTATSGGSGGSSSYYLTVVAPSEVITGATTTNVFVWTSGPATVTGWFLAPGATTTTSLGSATRVPSANVGGLDVYAFSVTLPATAATGVYLVGASGTNATSLFAASNIGSFTVNPVATQSALATLTTNLATLTTNVATLQTGLTSLTGSVTTIASGVTALQTSLTSLGTSVTALQTSITSIGTGVTSLQTSMTALSSSVAGVGKNLTTWGNTLNTGLSGISTSLASVANNAQSAATAATSASTAVASLQNSVNTLSTSISSITGSLTTLQGDVTSLQTSVNALSGLSGSVASLQTSVSNLNSTVSNDQTYILVVAALAVITLVLELAILIRKLS